VRPDGKLAMLLQSAMFALPWPLRRAALKGLFGYDIAKTARIGLSVVAADYVVLEEGARIGHFTVIRRIARLKLGNLNWISGSGAKTIFFKHESDRVPAVELADHAAVTQRHRIDCTNTVRIGAFSIVAGSGTQILTHGVDLKRNRQSSAPVEIGPYCFVGARSVFVKGSVLPGYCVLGAGSVLRGKQSEEYCLYSGVPAAKVKSLDKDYAYFHRTQGVVV